MVRKHQPKENIGKLQVAEIVLVQDGTMADPCRGIGATEQGQFRWRKGACQPQDGPGAAYERA